MAEEGEGNPIDPGWWNLGDGTLDDLVDSDVNLICRPEGGIPQSTSGGVTEGYTLLGRPTTATATANPRVRTIVTADTGARSRIPTNNQELKIQNKDNLYESL